MVNVQWTMLLTSLAMYVTIAVIFTVVITYVIIIPTGAALKPNIQQSVSLFSTDENGPKPNIQQSVSIFNTDWNGHKTE